ncbi:hypothetical protein [Parvicella tangerina]|uniref:Uncharacterized protein n=1 Tax=Parvicella tangerina TaxID=2829795 RepID=A0A916NH47_9FLAO|nr:hypothetical protein [Parvicella tangerina]CAG5082109.1 hypothetical protein CRYO30217_01810 [Parvicella tangerina]
MKKQLILFSFLWLGYGFQAQYIPINDVKAMDIASDAISVKEIADYSTIYGTVLYEFNKDQRIIKKTEFNTKTGEPGVQYIYEYQDNGLKAKKTKYVLEPGKEDTVVFEYNKYGIKICSCTGQGEEGAKYDDRGNVIETYKKNGDPYITTSYTYEGDQIKEKVHTDRYDNGTKIITENERGQITRMEMIGFAFDDRNELAIVESKYNADHKLAKEESIRYKTDKDGSRTDKIKDITYYIYEYGDHGNLILEQRQNKKGKVKYEKKYAYTYDEKGSWIEMYIDGELYKTREIQYK